MDLMKAIVVTAALMTPLLAAAEDMAPIALNSLDRAPMEIAGAKVTDEKGAAVGVVQKVETDLTGKPLGIDVVLGQGRLVQIAASDASYEATGNTVIADLTRARTLGPVAQR